MSSLSPNVLGSMIAAIDPRADPTFLDQVRDLVTDKG